MITSLSFSNFKSWRSVKDMRLAPVTGLFGGNSTGKTSILQLLLLLKQTVESSDRAQVLNFGDESDLVALGTYREVLFGHDLSRSFDFAFDWTTAQALDIADPRGARTSTMFLGDALRFEAQLRASDVGYPLVQRLSYGFDGYEFTMRRSGGTRQNYALSAAPTSSDDVRRRFRFVRTQGRKWPLPAPVKCFGFPDQVNTYFQNAGFLAQFERAFEDLFIGTYYLGPLREYPHREYTWGGGQPEDVGRRGQAAVHALLASRLRGPTNSRGYRRRRLTVEEHVAVWLKELELIHSFKLEQIEEGGNLYRVKVQKTAKSEPVLITDVGFGVSQILPVLVLCCYVPEGSIVILEQPEIHLHPAVQAGLADVFLEIAKTRRVQIIVESHSEYLLQRLQRRVAEEAATPDDVALYFTQYRDDRSNLVPLDLDLFGNITNWPRDFFGDSLGEMTAMARAALDRRRDADA